MGTNTSTNKAVFRWIDPFTGDMGEREWALASCDAPGVVRAMSEIDTMEAGLEPGKGAGYDFMALVEEHPDDGMMWCASFILRTYGLPHGSQLMVPGRVDLIK